MLLRDANYRPTDRQQEADVLIVNTCGFLEASKEESIGVLQELSRRKRKQQILVAAGCLVQRNGAEVIERVPKVDGLLGTRRWMEVLQLIGQIRSGKARRRLERYTLLGEADAPAPPTAMTYLGTSGIPALLGDPAIHAPARLGSREESEELPTENGIHVHENGEQ